MTRRVSQHSSSASMSGVYRNSGNASVAGSPLPSRGTRSMKAWLAQTSTWRLPRNSAIAAPIHVPSSAPPTNETIDDCSDTLGDVAATGDLYR
jgi:hypothetical protein